MSSGLKLSDCSFIYVRNKNRFGETQGILFELQKDWDWVSQESQKQIRSEGFADLIKNVCDLRGVNIGGIPIEKTDIEIAIESMKKENNDVQSNIYDTDKNGYLVHKTTGERYISCYGCSCVLVEIEGCRPARKGYRNGITASKDVIRSMCPLGYWKTARISTDSEIFYDDDALNEAASDFLVEGNHHRVKGYVPTEVFEAARKMQFSFEIPK